MDINFVTAALQLFIIVPGIFLASYLAFVSPSETINTLVSLDQNVRAKISKNILHIGIITVLAFGIYFAFGGVLLIDSPSWFKKGEYRAVLLITIFHIAMSIILLLLLYYIYRNQRLRFLLIGANKGESEIEREIETIKRNEKDTQEKEKKEKKITRKPKGAQRKAQKKKPQGKKSI